MTGAVQAVGHLGIVPPGPTGQPISSQETHMNDKTPSTPGNREDRDRVAGGADPGAIPRVPGEGHRASFHGPLPCVQGGRRLPLQLLRGGPVRRWPKIRLGHRLAKLLAAGAPGRGRYRGGLRAMARCAPRSTAIVAGPTWATSFRTDPGPRGCAIASTQSRWSSSPGVRTKNGAETSVLGARRAGTDACGLDRGSGAPDSADPQYQPGHLL